jgi:hypothetical protein
MKIKQKLLKGSFFCFIDFSDLVTAIYLNFLVNPLFYKNYIQLASYRRHSIKYHIYYLFSRPKGTEIS